MNTVYKTIRKFAVAITGFTVVIVGIALLVLPGPGILVIIAGLAILAIEFEWARRHQDRIKNKFKDSYNKLRKNGPPN